MGLMALRRRPGGVVFNPATLALSGWYRGSFSASPWTPTASAGASGTNGNLAEATNPPTSGTAQNAINPATFNGTNQRLQSATTISTFCGASACSVSILFKATAAGASSAGTAYNEPCLFGDITNGFFNVSFSTRGVTFSMFDGGVAYHEANVACATGAYHLAHCWWDGANLNVAVDSGTTTSAACASFFGASTTTSVGENLDGTKHFTGSILDMMVASVDLGSTARANIKSYVNSRYSLAL